MAEPQLKRRLTIPRDFSSQERRTLATLVIQFIQDRTQKGKDINNSSFPGYSESYKDSKEFELAGKTNRVNLSQTGDTIASIELLSEGPGYITIGYLAGSFENDKAVWLQRSDNGVSRKFLGLTDEDLNKLIRRVERERSPDDEGGARRLANNLIVSNILKRLGIDNG